MITSLSIDTSTVKIKRVEITNVADRNVATLGAAINSALSTNDNNSIFIGHIDHDGRGTIVGYFYTSSGNKYWTAYISLFGRSAMVMQGLAGTYTLYEPAAELDSRVYRATNVYGLNIPVRANTWMCGLLICNTNGGGNGVYYVENLNSSTVTVTAIKTNSGNLTQITGTISNGIMTLTGSTSTISNLRFDRATFISC